MTIPKFTDLSFEKQILVKHYKRYVEQDLKLRISGHSGKGAPEEMVLFTQFDFMRPILAEVPEYSIWVEACKSVMEDPEPEIIALFEGNAIILNENESQEAAFTRWIKAHPRSVQDHDTVCRYGNLTRAQLTNATMAKLREELTYIPSSWIPQWQIAQESFIDWLNSYIISDSESKRGRGRPVGSFKKAS